jgi:two-component system, OmpR family, sensor histidine kinase MtrB
MRPRAPGIRTRLTLTLVALVALTVAAIGIGVYAFVDASLRGRMLDQARNQVNYDLSVLLPGAVPSPVDRGSFIASGLPEAFALGGDTATVADFGDGDPYEPPSLRGALAQLSPALREVVAGGQLGYAWQVLDGRSVLVIGGRQGREPPELYFVFDAGAVDVALTQLRLGLVAAAVLATIVALAAAGIIARRILRPVDAAASAARRIGSGDLAARVPAGGSDEFGRWAAAFNEMAATLESTVERLEAAQRQNQRFVADVSHELRTPLTALVAEASIIETGLDTLPPSQRRAAELLVADVRRLRVLVEDLMEISRFDAGAERPAFEPVDLARLVVGVTAARLPEATVSVPPAPVMVDGEPRRVERILGNLLDNARAYAPDAPVEVAVVPALAGVVVVVADRGPGVAPEALPHLFERFFKADSSRAGGSSGLGLAIAAEHAALLGGTLRARLRPGGGLVFALTLPVTRSLPPRDDQAMSVADAGSASEPAPRSGT